MKLKEWRKKEGLTQRELSVKLGVQENSVIRYEAENPRCPAIPVLRKIMEITQNQVTMIDFFKDCK
jgi:Helix-turn-helix.